MCVAAWRQQYVAWSAPHCVRFEGSRAAACMHAPFDRIML